MLGIGFINIALLAGAAVAAVPVLIHLLSRRRRRTIDWGAMFLIEQVLREDRRRVELKQWLLLALRCLVLILLAIAMARPVLTHLRTAAGDDPAAVVIVIDASYSMGLIGSDQSTTFDRARLAASSIIDSLPKGSDARFLLAGDHVREVTANDLDQTVPVAGSSQFASAIADAEAQLASTTNIRREIIVISDALGETFALPNEAQTPVTWVRLKTEADFTNIAVTKITVSPGVPVPGRPVRIAATVTNTGSTDLSDVRVRLETSGVVRGEQRVNVRAGRKATTLFVHTFSNPGPQSLHVSADAGGDDLPADNRYYVALELPQTVPVLLISREVDRPFGENPGDFLSVALDPSIQEGDLPALLNPKVIPVGSFDISRLADFRIVFLADIPALSDEQVTALRRWVDEGGVLLAFPGANAQPNAYNGEMQSEAGGVLPAALVALRSDPTHFASGPYPHPALAPWNEPSNGDLAGATINRRWTLQPSSGATPILRFQTGEPAFVVERLGHGSVTLAAIPADGTWSNFPMRASFLPLIQQLVIDGLSATQPQRNLRSGEMLVLNGVDEVNGWSVDTPNSSRISTPVVPGSGALRIPNTEQPGDYLIRSNGKPVATFAVNADRKESMLLPADLDEATVVDGVAGWVSLDHDRRFGRDVWRPVWALALLFLFTESLFAGVFGREVGP